MAQAVSGAGITNLATGLWGMGRAMVSDYRPEEDNIFEAGLKTLVDPSYATEVLQEERLGRATAKDDALWNSLNVQDRLNNITQEFARTATGGAGPGPNGAIMGGENPYGNVRLEMNRFQEDLANSGENARRRARIAARFFNAVQVGRASYQDGTKRDVAMRQMHLYEANTRLRTLQADAAQEINRLNKVGQVSNEVKAIVGGGAGGAASQVTLAMVAQIDEDANNPNGEPWTPGQKTYIQIAKRTQKEIDEVKKLPYIQKHAQDAITNFWKVMKNAGVPQKNIREIVFGGDASDPTVVELTEDQWLNVQAMADAHNDVYGRNGSMTKRFGDNAPYIELRLNEHWVEHPGSQDTRYVPSVAAGGWVRNPTASPPVENYLNRSDGPGVRGAVDDAVDATRRQLSRMPMSGGGWGPTGNPELWQKLETMGRDVQDTVREMTPGAGRGTAGRTSTSGRKEDPDLRDRLSAIANRYIGVGTVYAADDVPAVGGQVRLPRPGRFGGSPAPDTQSRRYYWTVNKGQRGKPNTEANAAHTSALLQEIVGDDPTAVKQVFGDIDEMIDAGVAPGRDWVPYLFSQFKLENPNLEYRLPSGDVVKVDQEMFKKLQKQNVLPKLYNSITPEEIIQRGNQGILQLRDLLQAGTPSYGPGPQPEPGMTGIGTRQAVPVSGDERAEREITTGQDAEGLAPWTQGVQPRPPRREEVFGGGPTVTPPEAAATAQQLHSRFMVSPEMTRIAQLEESLKTMDATATGNREEMAALQKNQQELVALTEQMASEFQQLLVPYEAAARTEQRSEQQRDLVFQQVVQGLQTAMAARPGQSPQIDGETFRTVIATLPAQQNLELRDLMAIVADPNRGPGSVQPAAVVRLFEQAGMGAFAEPMSEALINRWQIWDKLAPERRSTLPNPYQTWQTREGGPTGADYRLMNTRQPVSGWQLAGG